MDSECVHEYYRSSSYGFPNRSLTFGRFFHARVSIISLLRPRRESSPPGALPPSPPSSSPLLSLLLLGRRRVPLLRFPLLLPPPPRVAPPLLRRREKDRRRRRSRRRERVQPEARATVHEPFPVAAPGRSAPPRTNTTPRASANAANRRTPREAPANEPKPPPNTPTPTPPRPRSPSPSPSPSPSSPSLSSSSKNPRLSATNAAGTVGACDTSIARSPRALTSSAARRMILPASPGAARLRAKKPLNAPAATALAASTAKATKGCNRNPSAHARRVSRANAAADPAP